MRFNYGYNVLYAYTDIEKWMLPEYAINEAGLSGKDEDDPLTLDEVIRTIDACNMWSDFDEDILPKVFGSCDMMYGYDEINDRCLLYVDYLNETDLKIYTYYSMEALWEGFKKMLYSKEEI